jgi:hypothetical protein
MQWITARLREDSTRSGLAQLSILIVMVAMMLGVDVNALLTQAEASASRIVALVATLAGAYATIARIVTPQPPAVTTGLPDAAVRGLERLGAMIEGPKP